MVTLFLLVIIAYLVFFRVIIPGIATSLFYGVFTFWTYFLRKEVSKDRLTIILVLVYVLTAILSCGYVVYYLREHPPMFD
jgi:hypothetical protein